MIRNSAKECAAQQDARPVGRGKMGFVGPAADAYAKEVVVADFEEAGDDDVLRKVRKDFDAKGVALSDQEIRKIMDGLMAQAVAQIKAGT